MPRDVVCVSFSLCDELSDKLRNKFDPHLVAIPSIRIRVDFEDAEHHTMDFDWDYSFETKVAHVQSNIFACDICAKMKDGELYADIRNKHWWADGAEKWFYDTVTEQQGMLNWMGIFSQWLIVQNYIARYGLIECFDVVEKVAKPKQNTHRSGKRKKNEVRLYKVYTLKKDWKTKKRRKNIYTCPSWNVRGYFRHNPSGTVTFVRPYVKGKDRNKQSTELGKEYKLVWKGSKHGKS